MTYFLFTNPILLKCQYLMNVEQNLVKFNQNDLQMELFKIYVTVFMPPTSKELVGHIGLGLSVCLSVRITFWQLRKLKNH